ncbi:MAG: hypothetical protein HC826_02540 [Rhodospirillales bacterium]|nr:hypothetical protein [Rhodospirillales bacterium]
MTDEPLNAMEPPTRPALMPPSPRVNKDRRNAIETAMAGLTNAIKYAASRDIGIDDQVIGRLVALRDSYIAGTWRSEDEQAFWPAYRGLVSGLAVPIDTLVRSASSWTQLASSGPPRSSASLRSPLLVFQLIVWGGIDSTLREIEALEHTFSESKQQASRPDRSPDGRRRRASTRHASN